MIESTLANISTIAFGLVPISIIINSLISKFFHKHDSALANTTTICTRVAGVLSKETLEINTICYDNFTIDLEEESLLAKVFDYSTKDTQNIPKRELANKSPIKKMAITTHLCHYPKLEELEKSAADFFEKLGLHSVISQNSYEILEKIPSSDEKKMSSIVAQHKQSAAIFSFSKGHPQSILDKCGRILLNGKKIDLSSDQKRSLLKRIKKLNDKGQKVIAYAYKGLPLKKLDHYSAEFAENDLIFLGFIGLSHPVNEEIQEHVQQIKELGVKTYILSKNKERKALSPAKELKLINEKYFEAISGNYLKDLSEQKLKKMLSNKEKDYIFVKLDKEDRHRIIQTLQEQGETVALADRKQNFKEIAEGIIKGRSQKENFFKVLFHGLNCKITETILLITSFFIGPKLALNIFTIIAIDLLINTPLELALKNSKKPTSQLKKPLFLAVTTALIITAVHIFNLARLGHNFSFSLNSELEIHTATTSTILLIVITQIFLTFSLKNGQKSLFSKETFSNLYLNLTAIIVILVSYFSTILFSNELGITALSPLDWQIIAFTTFILITLDEVHKLFIRKKNVPNRAENPQE